MDGVAADTVLPWVPPPPSAGGTPPSGISLSRPFCVSQRVTLRPENIDSLNVGGQDACATVCAFCNSNTGRRTEISDQVNGVRGIRSISELNVCWSKTVCVWSVRAPAADTTLVLLASLRSSTDVALTLALRGVAAPVAAAGNIPADVAATQLCCALPPDVLEAASLHTTRCCPPGVAPGSSATRQ